MNNEIERLEQPYNANERYLYAVCVRLDAIIHMMSNFLEIYANQENIPTTSNIIEDEDIVKKPIEEDDEIVYDNDINYNLLNKSDIIDILKDEGAEFTTRMTKGELIELLEEIKKVS